MAVKSFRFMAGLSRDPHSEQVQLTPGNRVEITGEINGCTDTKILEIVLQADADVYIGSQYVAADGSQGGSLLLKKGEGEAYTLDNAKNFSLYIISSDSVNVSVNRYR